MADVSRQTGVVIEEWRGPAPDQLEVELVERKGIGHPDTICDAALDRVGQALCGAYRERFGAILHHNCDKGLLVAGRARHRFGGGEVLEPMRLVIGDRASAGPDANPLPIRDIAIEAARSWFREHLASVDPERHVRFQVALKPGSEELTRLFRQSGRVLGANDTSAAVGYAPLTETESLVLEAEHFLNSGGFKRSHPETGEDVKVLGLRRGRRLELTVAMPLLDRLVPSERLYFEKKEELSAELLRHLSAQLRGIEEVGLELNALDRRGEGTEGAYLSVVGTSAEDADSGEVGRGNRANGLIAFNRPSGMEAVAGKNPVSHVGKIYGVLSHSLAHRLRAEVSGLRGVTVWLCSRIGWPIDHPWVVSIQAVLEPGAALSDAEPSLRAVVADALARIPEFCLELAEGRHCVC
jgi:S-adenosylmethionine synthetase